MDITHKTRRVFRTVHRLVLFLFLFFLVDIVLFLIGNMQYFLDSTQRIILKITAGTGGFLFFFSGSACLFEIYFTVSLRKIRYIGYCVISILACISGLVGSGIAIAILILSSGTI
ncbi:MAG: hypothetical protein ACTTH7_01520 [Treponema sp.]